MLFKRHPLTALIATVLSVSALPLAQAEEANTLPAVKVTGAAEASQNYQPVTSTVGGKTEKALTDIPQTVNVVNKALMQAQGATSLADALRNAPGITIGGAEGGQIGNNINLRGFTARTDIYLDGFRDRGQYYRDVFNLEQIEVLQGPSSMLFGRGSTGGVINQVSKKAQLNDFTEISGTIGSDGRVRTTYDNNSKISDTAAMRVNVFGQNLQTTRDTIENEDFGFAPTISFGIGGPTELTVSALLQRNNDMVDYGVVSLNGSPITPSRDAYYGQSSDHTDQDIMMFNTTIKHQFNQQLSIRNQTQINRYTTNAVQTAPRALATCNTGVADECVIPNSPPAFGNFDPNQLYVQMRSKDRNFVDTSVDNQTDVISQFTTGSIEHELIVGVEVGHDTYTNQAFSRTGVGLSYVNYVPLMNPTDVGPAVVTVTTGNLANASANSLGYYFNDTLSLTDQWKVVAGLRRDSFHGEIDNTTSAPAGHTEQNSDFTSRRLGLLYQPTSDQSYYASYGTSFNPLLEQMTLTNGTQALPPTNSRSYELGGKWMVMDEKASLAAAIFDGQQNNVYTRDASGIYQAVGNVKIKGYSLSAVGYATDKLQISSGYMHMLPQVVNTLDATNGSIPANTPQNTLNVWATYELTSNWEIGGGPNFMSQRYVANTAPLSVDKVSVPSYARWDATVAYHQPEYEVRLNLLNVTDKFYYDGLIQSDGGRAVPGIGRTALVTGTYHF